MAVDWRETMNKRRKEGKFCDFKILVEEQTILVHRIVLDTFSEYFRVMFSNEMREAQEGSCDLSGFTALAGKAVVEFLYTGQLELSKDSAQEILQLSHMWQLDEAVKKCNDFLRRSIDASTCIATRRIAVIYNLKDLAQTALEFILDNLDDIQTDDGIMDMNDEDITSVLDGAQDHDPAKLWSFFVRWRQSQNDFAGNDPCDAMLRFPIGKFSVVDFRQHVWDDDHVQSCDSCQQFAANSMLACVASSAVQWNDAIFVRELSKQFHHSELLKATEKVIIENHFKVFTDEEFYRIEKEDLINFTAQIQAGCAIDELSAIISWMKCDTNRHDAFANIFGSRETSTGRSTSAFVASLSTNMDLYKPSGLAHDCESRPWREIFFLRSLARRYICKEVESMLDQCIVGNIDAFSNLDGFKTLDQSDVIKYMSSPGLKLDEHVTWRAVKRWTEHDFEARKSLFQKLFDCLPLDRFSTKFIRERIHKYPLVQHSIVNMNVLMSVLLDKLHKIERTSLEERQNLRLATENLDKRLDNMQLRTAEDHSELVEIISEQAKKIDNMEPNAARECTENQSTSSQLSERLDKIEKQLNEKPIDMSQGIAMPQGTVMQYDHSPQHPEYSNLPGFQLMATPYGGAIYQHPVYSTFPEYQHTATPYGAISQHPVYSTLPEFQHLATPYGATSQRPEYPMSDGNLEG